MQLPTPFPGRPGPQGYPGRQPLWEQWWRQRDPFLDATNSTSCNPSSRPWGLAPVVPRALTPFLCQHSFLPFPPSPPRFLHFAVITLSTNTPSPCETTPHPVSRLSYVTDTASPSSSACARLTLPKLQGGCIARWNWTWLFPAMPIAGASLSSWILLTLTTEDPRPQKLASREQGPASDLG